MTPVRHEPVDATDRAAFIHREFLQIAILASVAVAGFLITRAVALDNRATSRRDAAQWFDRGRREVDSRELDAAIDSFRKAIARNRDEKRYVLALAQALTLEGEYETARGALLTLRESAPEDHEINLRLARVAVARSDVTEALRYYHNALYAPWPVEQADDRRTVRLELIGFLLTHDQNSRALSELIALSTDIPDDAGLHRQVAHLFAMAGDHRHALDQFQRALRLAPENRDALAGAGQAAFQLGDYVVARGYLRRVSASGGDVGRTLQVVELVLARDPLANRIGASERRQRLIANFEYVEQRLNACLDRLATGAARDEAMSLQRETDIVAHPLTGHRALDQDGVEAVMDLVDRIEQHLARHCGAADPLDQALRLIGHQHGGSAQ